MEKLLKAAIDAAIEASERIMEIYQTEDFGINFKLDNTPLTKADLAANEIITKRLSKLGIPILSEEGRTIEYDERKKWEKLWIVDPIDGTKEFIKRNGEFTVNIALIEKQRPIAGVVLVPALDNLYFSSANLGSFKVANISDFKKTSSLSELIEIAERLPLENTNRPITVVASRSHLSNETAAFIRNLEAEHGKIEILSKGSSLKLCMIAENAADFYPRFAPTMEWDTAAGQAIIDHSGGKLIEWKTKEPLNYNRKNLLNPWFLAVRDVHF